MILFLEILAEYQIFIFIFSIKISKALVFSDDKFDMALRKRKKQPRSELKNYTSEIPAEQTISKIEMELAAIGATKISKTYQGIICRGISFEIYSGNAKMGYIQINIPANLQAVRELLGNTHAYRNKREDWLAAQAQRTGWKIVLDWVQAQCAMIRLQRVEALQVFLPYAYNHDTGQTLFEQIQDRESFKLLGE